MMYKLTSELAHFGTLMHPVVNAEADETSVKTVHIGHLIHPLHKQSYQEDGDVGPTSLPTPSNRARQLGREKAMGNKIFSPISLDAYRTSSSSSFPFPPLIYNLFPVDAV